MARHRRPPLVEVVWLDAVTYTEQWSLEDVPRRAVLAERRTAGYLLHDDLNGLLVLAGTFDPGPEAGVADVTVIPRAWVKDVKGRGRRRKEATTNEHVQDQRSGAADGADGGTQQQPPGEGEHP